MSPPSPTTVSHDHRWHLGCVLPRVPAISLRAGFRFAEVTVEGGRLPAELTVDSVVGVNLRTAAAAAATLRFGPDPHDPDNLVQRLSNNSWWTEAAALMSIPAGAAGRGERNGWTGDAAFASESECFDFATGAFFSRYLDQVSDTCGQHGEIGAGVPNQGTSPSQLHSTSGTNDPSWSAVFPLVAFNVWKYHNGTASVARAWPWLRRYMSLLETNYSISPHTLARWGDWNPAYPEPRNPQGQGPPFTRTVSHITGAAMVVQNHVELAEMARAMGYLEDAERWEAMLPTLKREYHESFFDAESQVYGDGTPTAYATALWLGVTPPELLPTVVENFVKQLASVQYRMVSVGFIGVRCKIVVLSRFVAVRLANPKSITISDIFEALSMVNRTDVALRMLHQREYPSFGWQITNDMEPATSLWESYDAPTMRQCESSSGRPQPLARRSSDADCCCEQGWTSRAATTTTPLPSTPCCERCWPVSTCRQE